MKYKVPFIKPSFPSPEEVAGDYGKIVESNWFTNFGPFEREFSERAARYLGDDGYVGSVSNATLGLLIAIKVLFTKKNGKVLVPSFTFSAGPEMLLMSDFTPVFIDIDSETWQPDIEQAKEYIRSNRAEMSGILLCNIFGVGNKSIEEWEELSKKYDLPLIIDSAAGFGSLYSEGEKIGLRGDCEIFSLHATKPFAVGEGGLIASRSKEFIEKVQLFENFGFDHNKKINMVGINAKLQEFNAAIGLRQLKDFESRLANRRSSLKLYKDKLAGTNCVFQDNDSFSTVPFVSVLAESAELATATIEKLNSIGVEARKYYEPLHYQDVLLKNAITAGPLIVTEDVYSRIVSLPLHDNMSVDSMSIITDTIIRLYEKHKS